ncbi:RcnB family protein [Sphingomonas sp.]|uniref:RcnB family protein n=1 Tax=Sphingomonas sp. TaxID=28214 RepID=UPI0025ED7E6B|nr:RcnB family protein [Sphingomonas sp.]MBV9528866.1 RcnB family protein [Sphingomonas sp.]
MRKIIFGLLLAGAAAPALAAGGPNRHNDDSDRDQPRAERPVRNNDDEARPQRPQNVQRPQFNGGQGRADFQRPQFNGGPGRPDFQRPQFEGDAQHVRPSPNGNAFADGDRDSVRNWRAPDQRGQQDGYWQQRARQGGYWQQRNVRQQPANGYNRDWQRNQRPDNSNWRDRSGRVQWNRDWRNDRRYDWRERREHHHSLFHLGLYIDPFGWGYQSFGIGYQLRPNYYEQNYWIDPAMYGLPYPPPGTQWVRYWNDALLVDMYSGQVVDEIQGFFW